MTSLFRWLIIVLCFLQLVACAGTAPTHSPISVVVATVPPPKQLELPPQNSIIHTAREMIGTPYHYGGTSPRGFDCSGLVYYIYQHAGIPVPRTSSEQYRQADKIELSNIRSGDLLFFRLSPPKISHVGIYDRNGTFIHAPSSGKRVSYASLQNPYWKKHLVGAGRF